MTLMRMLTLNSYHSQIHNVDMVNELGAMPPIGPIANGHIVVPYPSHDVMANEYTQVPL